jgi:hypothetical protein
LKNVALTSLHSNPFRDLEEFPLIQGKLDRLQESIEAEGFWEGVIARPRKKGGYEIAFGHHRVYAAKKALGDDAKVPVIVRDLDDDRMLHFMSRENAEEFGHDFYNTVVQSVRSVVLAYGAGKVELEKPEMLGGKGGVQKHQVRFAPSFSQGVDGNPSRIYTVDAVADYLGLHEPKGGAAQRVYTALSVLELLEEGSLKPRAIMGLDHGAVREVVVAAKQAADRARQESEARDKGAADKRVRDERMAQLDAERAQRDYEKRVKADGEAKAAKERAEMAAARKKYEEEQAEAKRATLDAKRAADKAALDAKIAAAKDVTEKLKTQTVAAVQDERKAKLLVVAPPSRAPVRATDLSPCVVKLQDEAARLAANAEAFISMARDPGNAVSVRDLRRLATLLRECGEKGREVSRIVEKR